MADLAILGGMKIYEKFNYTKISLCSRGPTARVGNLRPAGRIRPAKRNRPARDEIISYHKNTARRFVMSSNLQCSTASKNVKIYNVFFHLRMMIPEHVIHAPTGLVHFRTKLSTALRRKRVFGPKVNEPRTGPGSSYSDFKIRLLRESQNTTF